MVTYAVIGSIMALGFVCLYLKTVTAVNKIEWECDYCAEHNEYTDVCTYCGNARKHK